MSGLYLVRWLHDNNTNAEVYDNNSNDNDHNIDDNANNSDNDDVDIDSLPTEVELLCVVHSSASKHLTSHPGCHQPASEYELCWDWKYCGETIGMLRSFVLVWKLDKYKHALFLHCNTYDGCSTLARANPPPSPLRTFRQGCTPPHQPGGPACQRYESVRNA